jgi:hypothetical protein
MAVAELPTYQHALEFYNNLLKLRWMRDRSHKAVARDWRKQSPEGNIWHYAQYRPTYSQESVADVVSAIEATGTECKLHWEDTWRRGDQTYWNDVKVEHVEMPKCNPRDKFVVLRRIADDGFKSYSETSPDRVKLILKDLPEIPGTLSEEEKAAAAAARKSKFRKIPDNQDVKVKKRALEKARVNLANVNAKLAKIRQEGGGRATKQQLRQDRRTGKSALARASRAVTIAKQKNSLAVKGIKLKVRKSSRFAVTRR